MLTRPSYSTNPKGPDSTGPSPLGTVDGVTSAWVWALSSKDFRFLAWAMYFPGLFALAVEAATGDVPAMVRGALFGLDAPPRLGTSYPSIPAALALSVVLPCAMVALCAAVSVAAGWGRVVFADAAAGRSAVHAHNKALVFGFLRAAGEELGWRCWLLPRLAATRSPVQALLWSGVAWGPLSPVLPPPRRRPCPPPAVGRASAHRAVHVSVAQVASTWR